jgi:zinc metalloprotease ZmpB
MAKRAKKDVPDPQPLRTMEFDESANAYIIRDRQAMVRGILHTQKPVVIEAAMAIDAAESYLRANWEQIGLHPSELENLRSPPLTEPLDIGVEFRILSEKRQFDVTTVTFQQTCLGLPIWQAGISIHLKQLPNVFEAILFQTTRQEQVAPDGLMPTAEQVARLKSVDERILAQQLGLADKVTQFDVASLRVSHKNLMIYRYDAKKRAHLPLAPPDGRDSKSNGMPLPPIPDDVVDGSYNVVAAVYFDIRRKERSSTHWLALIEARRLSVLHLEEFAPGIRGMVFPADPVTMHGGPLPSAGDNQLNPRRVWADLRNLYQTVPQQLVGSNVRIEDFEAPQNTVPTEQSGTDFAFGARSNEFAAVNAYFHCSRFFEYVESLGFTRAEYFPGTTFPIDVDPRGTSTQDNDPNSVNAQCRLTTMSGPNGTTIGGIDSVIFCLADPVDPNIKPPLGLAADWRIVLHELGGHGTLQNHVCSSYFGFAHSAGDSLAAILSDPESKAPQKGRTFPWVFPDIDRQHDRKSGWYWDGPRDVNDGFYQLDREQILSSTHFRLYKSMGGGNTTQVNVRNFAARFVSYLILLAIKTLTPPTNPQHASDWLGNLIVADAADWTSEGHTGGAYEKVVRWAFEKQGLFGGSPPDVDVYIDDGRHGEYTYKSDHASCRAIWNRRTNDGGQGHQAPVPGVTNYAYVKIKNRGGKAAKSIAVSAFQNKPQSTLIYPDGWQPMHTYRLTAPDLPPHSADVEVGPFAWVPRAAGDNFILMAVSASGDVSNLGKFRTGKSIPDWRLVPNDNNLGMRKV